MKGPRVTGGLFVYYLYFTSPTGVSPRVQHGIHEKPPDPVIPVHAGMDLHEHEAPRMTRNYSDFACARNIIVDDVYC